jgi:hypothetical protein
MINPDEFTNRQFDFIVEFGKYVIDHPEVDDISPDGAHVYFEVEGETEFNQYSRQLAEQHHRKEGIPIVRVRVKGLLPLQGSRLIDPVIEPVAEVA